MVYRKLYRLDIHVVAYNVCRQNMALRVVDDTARRIQHETLDVFRAGTLRETCPTHDLPVIEPAEQDNHNSAYKQEDEHLPAACAA